jgi:hypothetical protein
MDLCLVPTISHYCHCFPMGKLVLAKAETGIYFFLISIRLYYHFDSPSDPFFESFQGIRNTG